MSDKEETASAGDAEITQEESEAVDPAVPADQNQSADNEGENNTATEEAAVEENVQEPSVDTDIVEENGEKSQEQEVGDAETKSPPETEVEVEAVKETESQDQGETEGQSEEVAEDQTEVKGQAEDEVENQAEAGETEVEHQEEVTNDGQEQLATEAPLEAESVAEQEVSKEQTDETADDSKASDKDGSDEKEEIVEKDTAEDGVENDDTQEEKLIEEKVAEVVAQAASELSEAKEESVEGGEVVEQQAESVEQQSEVAAEEATQEDKEEEQGESRPASQTDQGEEKAEEDAAVTQGEEGEEAAATEEVTNETEQETTEIQGETEEEKTEVQEETEEEATEVQGDAEEEKTEAPAEAEEEATDIQAEPEAEEQTTDEVKEEESEAQETGGGGDVELDKNEIEAAAEQFIQETSDMNQSSNTQELPEIQQDSIPAPPHLPSPERSHTDIEGQMSTSALNVVWSFGLNRNVPVLNLSDGVRNAIMYPCAHVGIMYDFRNNKQHILQAHLNPITCSAISQDKRWLVTGDVGPDAMVNIWDTYTGTPIQTMFDPNPSGGVVAVALTPDSRYLATLSALPIQTLAIWDWTVDGDVPICSADLKPEYGLQNFIYFDPTDIYHMVTNSETQVLFYHWEARAMKYFAPPLTDQDFNKPVGRYSQSIFQQGIARALTATSIGNLVVWDNNKPLSKVMDVNQSADKKPLKIIKVHDKGINVLTTTDKYIVLGDTAGHVKFYDQGLRLIYWYADFHSGPCTAISFAHMPEFVPTPMEGQKFPSDATKQAKPFVVRDFVVGTSIAVYGNIQTDGSKFKVIHREHDAAVHALAAHPKLPIIALGSYSGLLKLWNYRTKETIASRMFEKMHIQCCAFDPKGLFLAVGCTNGALYLVDSVALLDQLNEPYRYSRDTITHIAFSHNSQYLATADAGCAVTVFKRHRKEGKNPYVWHGRYRSHYKAIKDLTFGTHLDTNEPKLLTLGEDRMLIEYDLNHVDKTNNHIFPSNEDRIEQSAMTQCMAWYPPITKEAFLFTANDQYKLKCYNSVTKMCRKTVLGPTYGSPIRKMMVVPTTGPEDKDRYLAYITDDKVGLHFLPATGNPHLAMALIAHPSGVSNLACSFDGSYLFTAGGPDYAVHMWEINVTALEAQAKLGGEDLIPFYGLLEGGRDGEMFAELEDLFYYAQLRHQGINSMETRQIGNRVPISEVPFIMRAMGYYPSEQEIEDMLNEIKYQDYVNNGQYQEDIDLGSFIKLYINHRPAFGLNPEKLLWAFQTLAADGPGAKGGYIERGDLLDLLQKKGEHMTEYELAEHLTTLLGYNREGGSCEQEMFDAESAGGFIAETLPYDINTEVFVNEILGFSMNVDPPGQENTKGSVQVYYGGIDQ